MRSRSRATGERARATPWAELLISSAHTALQTSLITQPGDMAPEVLERLRVILD